MKKKNNKITNNSLSLLLIIGVALLFSITLHANSPNSKDAKKGNEAKQVIWWHNDELVKNTLLSALTLGTTYQELSSKYEFVEHFSNVTDLLLLFDSMESDSSLKTLASFSSYYLGAHASEIYSCLLLRKGKRIKPFLERMLSSRENECIRKFKEVPTVGTSGAKASACLSDADYRKRLKQILNAIENNESCVIEQ